MSRLPHILIVDDDREIRSLVAQFLKKHGYRVTPAADGREMMHLMEKGRFDLIVLDLMLPGEDGLSLCRRVRAESSMPIIMLTAMGEEMDRIIGLEMGADDYLPKPFNPRELLDTVKRELRAPDGALVPLTAGEFELLSAMVERAGQVLSRDQLLDLTRGRDAAPFDRSVDVLISRLRRKIESDPKEPSIIKTVRGGGYILSSGVVPQ
jgi:two-component system OmpR family response regulator